MRILSSWNLDLWGQPLALGCVLAYLRTHDQGALGEAFDIRPVMSHDQLLEELAADTSPAIILFSDYIWSAQENLEVAAEARALGAEHLIISGGPHVPKFQTETEAHFRRNPAIDVVVHGEGEITLAALIECVGPDLRGRGDLGDVLGVTFRSCGGATHTGERPRHDRLEDFPSPYLTGEFDHLDPSGWQWPGVETDRGCPYSCTFCDWGSATRSRIRQFPLDRVKQELRWIAERGLPHWMINDANFGIHARDVEIAEWIVQLREEFDVPRALYVNYAKNTVKHLAKIIRMLTVAGIAGEGAIALQTRDEATLKAIKRQNIRIDKYDELAAEFRKNGLPLVTDLIIGLPGQTVDSLLFDMQYCIDSDVTPRFFVSLTLPNAEMNDPEYRERFRIVLGDGNVVVETSSFDRSDRERMMRLRMAYRCFEHLGMLRHVSRVLQWDHGIPASTLIDRTEQRVHEDPDRFPLLSWTLGYLDVFLIPPYSWQELYAEVLDLVDDEFALGDDAGLTTALEVQLALMPHRQRRFPLTVPLPHDYVAWYTGNMARITDAGPDVGPLTDFEAGELLVSGDPIERCQDALLRVVDDRPHELLTGPFWTTWHWELDSPLQRVVPEMAVAKAAQEQLQGGR